MPLHNYKQKDSSEVTINLLHVCWWTLVVSEPLFIMLICSSFSYAGVINGMSMMVGSVAALVAPIITTKLTPNVSV